MDYSKLPWNWTLVGAKQAYGDYCQQTEEPMKFDEWLYKHRILDRQTKLSPDGGIVRTLSEQLHV